MKLKAGSLARRVVCAAVFGLFVLCGQTNFANAQTLFPGRLSPFAGSLDATATGDLNGDGKQDVVLATDSYYFGQISVFFGSSDGVLSNPATYTIYAYGLSSVTLADVNGDGKLDIVAGNYGVPGRYYSYPYSVSNCVSVLINKGNGTFKPAVNYYVGNGGGPTLADVNGDGKPDLVAPDYNGNAPFNGPCAAVLLNNGNGTFGAKTDYATNGGSNVTLVDVNGDGKPDLLTTGYGQNNVSVLLNNGNGTYAEKADYAGYSPNSRLLMQDVNGDGKPDMITASTDSSSYASVRLNNGDGTFGARADYPVGYNPQSIALADINGDGKLDLITRNYGKYDSYYGTVLEQNSISVLLGNGDGTFSTTTRVVMGEYAPIYVADIDGDGRADLVTYTSNGSNNAAGKVSVLYGGSTVLLTRADYAVPEYPQVLQILDVTGDGRPDIVTSGNYTVSILQYKGSRNFAAHRDYLSGLSGITSGYVLAISFADVTGDGRPDLVLAQEATVYPNNGDGTFHGVPAYPLIQSLSNGYGIGYSSIVTADMNGDGKLDVIGNCGSYLALLRGNGDGTFQPEIDYTGITNVGIYAFAIGDLNGDGKPDVVTVENSVNNIRVSLNNGTGGFISGGTYALGTSPGTITLTDVNGDGKLDLVVLSPGYEQYFSGVWSYVNASFVVMLGNGDGTFQAGSTYHSPDLINALQVVDFNGDGKSDIAISTTQRNSQGSATSTYLSIYSGNGDGTFSPPAGSYPLDVSSGGCFRLADVNGDGKPDLLSLAYGYFAGYYANRLKVALNNGNGAFGTGVIYSDAPVSQNVILTADINGDGKTDLITKDSNSVGILLGNGDGTFQPAISYESGYTTGFAIADMNGDGRPDILTGTGSTIGAVGVLLNQGVPLVNISGTITLEGIAPNAAPQDILFGLRTGSNTVQARTASVGPDGAFTLFNVPENVYTLRAKGAKYLANIVTADASAGSVSGITLMLRAGDANGDNACDIADFGLLVNVYGTSSGNAAYDARTDFNGDGTVDIADFGLLVNNYGLAGAL